MRYGRKIGNGGGGKEGTLEREKKKRGEHNLFFSQLGKEGSLKRKNRHGGGGGGEGEFLRISAE